MMQSLAWIGKGLRAPSDVPVELDGSVQDRPSFWIDGPGQTVQASVLARYGSVMQTVNKHADSIFVEACCDFIRSGFTEEHPSPFKFPDQVGLNLLASLINLDNPNIDSTMACASSFMASVDLSRIEACMSGLLDPIASNQQAILNEYRRSGQLLSSTLASSSLEFQGRLMTKWGIIWYSRPDVEETLGTAIEMSLVLLADPDTLPDDRLHHFLQHLPNFLDRTERSSKELRSRCKERFTNMDHGSWELCYVSLGVNVRGRSLRALRRHSNDSSKNKPW